MSIEALQQNTFNFINGIFDDVNEYEDRIIFKFNEVPFVCSVVEWQDNCNIVRIVCPDVISCPNEETALDLAKNLYADHFVFTAMVKVVAILNDIGLMVEIPTDKGEVLTISVLGEIMKALFGEIQYIHEYKDRFFNPA